MSNRSNFYVHGQALQISRRDGSSQLGRWVGWVDKTQLVLTSDLAVAFVDKRHVRVVRENTPGMSDIPIPNERWMTAAIEENVAAFTRFAEARLGIDDTPLFRLKRRVSAALVASLVERFVAQHMGCAAEMEEEEVEQQERFERSVAGREFRYNRGTPFFYHGQPVEVGAYGERAAFAGIWVGWVDKTQIMVDGNNAVQLAPSDAVTALPETEDADYGLDDIVIPSESDLDGVVSRAVKEFLDFAASDMTLTYDNRFRLQRYIAGAVIMSYISRYRDLAYRETKAHVENDEGLDEIPEGGDQPGDIAALHNAQFQANE